MLKNTPFVLLICYIPEIIYLAIILYLMALVVTLGGGAVSAALARQDRRSVSESRVRSYLKCPEV